MTSSAGPTSALEAAAPLERDLSCLNCGYNLRGMPCSADCPECGMAIGVSLRRDSLADAPADWLVTLRGGAGMIWWGVLLAFPLPPVGMVLAWMGLWRVTLAEPHRIEPWTDRRARLAARVFATLGTLGLALLLSVTAFALLDRDYRFGARWMEMDVVLIAAAAVWYLGWLAGWEVMRQLALRMPGDDPTARCRLMQRHWLVGIGIIIGLALTANAANLVYAITGARVDWVAPLLAAAVAATMIWLWVATLRFAGAWRRAMGDLIG